MKNYDNSRQFVLNLRNVMDINHISVSRKKCFDQCQQQYKYRYHLKMENPGPEQFHFIYGKTVHTIAELYVEGKGQKCIDQITQDILDRKIQIEDNKYCPNLEPDVLRKLKRHVKSIKKLTDRIGTDGYVEYEFKYDIDPPNNKIVTGFIDRLIVKDDKAFILDYKTTKKGKFRVNKSTVKDDLQLRVYARVVQKDFGINPENIKCALFYFEGEEIVAAQYNEQSLIEAENELKVAYDRIVKADENKVWGNVGWHCNNCDYKSICHFYKGKDAADTKWDGCMGINDHWS